MKEEKAFRERRRKLAGRESLAFPFPKPACSGSVAALVSSENPQKGFSDYS
uniref:Uncharacterized protein n=1 Tax=Fagus sylvatica TaxID=28930 RepID=A0A2N9I3Z4_FAGSY